MGGGRTRPPLSFSVYVHLPFGVNPQSGVVVVRLALSPLFYSLRKDELVACLKGKGARLRQRAPRSVNGNDNCRRPRVDNNTQTGESARDYAPEVDWDEHAAREEERYADGLSRLPEDPDARQKQLVRVAMAAGGAGVARLMQDRKAESAGWWARSAERYRESYEGAPPGSWGRLIGAVKARILAGDWGGAAEDARWALEQDPAASGSPIGVYAAALALLTLAEDEQAAAAAAPLKGEEFPQPVADALAALAAHDHESYAEAVRRVLESFETREEYLEDMPVADTVIVLEALAARRGFAARLESPLLPGA